jgi:hypothetical protein
LDASTSLFDLLVQAGQDSQDLAGEVSYTTEVHHQPGVPLLDHAAELLAHYVDGRLLEELLRIELHWRREAGESPTSEEYQSRFPGHARTIEGVFAEAAPHRPSHQSPQMLECHFSWVAGRRLQRHLRPLLHLNRDRCPS